MAAPDVVAPPRARGFTTTAVHAGQEPDPLTGAVVPPIYQTSTFVQDGVNVLRAGHEYSRGSNPTRAGLETQLAALEAATAPSRSPPGSRRRTRCCGPCCARGTTSSSARTAMAGRTAW